MSSQEENNLWNALGTVLAIVLMTGVSIMLSGHMKPQQNWISKLWRVKK